MTKSQYLKMGAIALGLLVPTTSALATETWLACQGTVTRSSYKIDDPASGMTEISRRMLMIDDATRTAYERGSPSWRMNGLNIKKFAPDKIEWGSFGRLSGNEEWDAIFDRTKMRLEMTSIYSDTTQLKWEEQCKPTDPPVLPPAFVASSVKGQSESKKDPA